MTFAQFNRRLRQIHLAFGIAIGLQVLLWMVSGFLMALFPIDTVRGAHLRAPVPQMGLDLSQPVTLPVALTTKVGDAQRATLLIVGDEMAWLVESDTTRILLSRDGETLLSPLDEEHARRIADAVYGGRGLAMAAVFYPDATPREAGRPGPLWRVDFGPDDRASLYVDAISGEVKAIRTPLWRVFDFFWGLHIMDWSTRENFNSWWLRATALFGALFAISGLVLAGARLLRRRAGRSAA